MQETLPKKPFRFPALDLVVWAETEEEATKVASNEAKKKPKPNAPEDLNGDGKFDEVDASIAGKTLSKSKTIKQ